MSIRSHVRHDTKYYQEQTAEPSSYHVISSRVIQNRGNRTVAQITNNNNSK